MAEMFGTDTAPDMLTEEERRARMFASAGGMASRAPGTPYAGASAAPRPSPTPIAGSAPPGDVTPGLRAARDEIGTPSLDKAVPTAIASAPSVAPGLRPTTETAAPAKPRLGGWKRGLDVAGQILAPGIEELIPGSAGYNRLKENREIGLRKTRADIADTESQTSLRDAQAEAARRGKPDKPENLQQAYADTVQDAINRGVDPNSDPKSSQIADSIQRIQKEPKPPAQKTPNDFEQFYAQYTRDNNLPDNAKSRLDARKAWEGAGQKPTPEPGNYQPVTDARGNTVGWVDPKSSNFKPVSSIPGIGNAAGAPPGGALPRKPTGQEESRLAQAEVITRAGNDLIGQITQNRAKIGNVKAIINSAFLGTPMSDPVSAGIAAQLASFAALNPAMHGFKGTDALREFEKLVGKLPNNPDAMIAAIKGILRTASAFDPNAQQGKSGFKAF